MNLGKKKALAAKALKIGKNRVNFNTEGLSEIKEAITKQDIKTLVEEGIITIKPVKGRKKIKRRKTRRGPGKIKKKVSKRKQTYVKITRKLRDYLKQLRDRGAIKKDLYWELRKKIKMRAFKSKARFKEYLDNIEKVDLGKKVEKKEKSQIKRTKTDNLKQKKDKRTRTSESSSSSKVEKDTNKKQDKEKK